MENTCVKLLTRLAGPPLALAIAFAVGIGNAFQYGLLDEASKAFDKGHRGINGSVLAVLVAYSGSLLLSALCLPSPVAKYYSTYQEDRRPFQWWMVLGGTIGAIGVVCVAISASNVSAVVLVSLSYNLGALVGGFSVDSVGFLGTPKWPVGWLKCASLILFTVGLLLFSVKENKLDFQPYTLFTFAGGVLDAIQPCINRITSEALPYGPQANAINYFSGSITLGILWVVIYYIQNRAVDIVWLAWYYYAVPSCMGFLVVLSFFLIAPKIGIALFTMTMIVAETVTTLILTTTTTTEEDRREMTWWMGGGLVCAIGGVLLGAYAQYGEEQGASKIPTTGTSSIKAMSGKSEESPKHDDVAIPI